MTTTVIILVLVAIAVLAVVSVPLMIKSTRRQLAEDEAGRPKRPIMGSPAQVWTSRGERVQRELDSMLAEYGGMQAVATDAAQVVSELRLTAGQVAELDHALSLMPVNKLTEERDRLSAELADAAGQPAAEDLSRSHESVSARLAAANRLRDTRAALLAKMEAAVAGLEQARDELAELIATAAVAPLGGGQDTARELTSRLAGLREALVEVRQLTNPGDNPEIDPGRP